MSEHDGAQRAEDAEQPPASPTIPPATTTSYVYPVRSLLSGILPAARQTRSDESKDIITSEGGQEGATEEPTRHEKAVFGQEDTESSRGTTALSRAALAAHTESHHHTGGQIRFSTSRRRKHLITPNFRDFSRDDDPLSPRIFSSVPPGYFPAPDSISAPGSMLGSADEPVEVSNLNSEAETPVDSPRHPVQISEAAADAFAGTTTADHLLHGTLSESDLRAPSNISQTGIVHLPPLEPSSAPTSFYDERANSSRGRESLRSGARSADASLPRSSQCAEITQGPGPMNIVHMPSTQDQNIAPRIASPQQAPANGSGSSLMSSGSEGPHMSFRYQHIEDDSGHHLIVGREGLLARCEDEPIRTPGAVQGFGILVAIEEDNETGNLVVRQVSENSTELLGLSPQYLFSLECLSRTFPDEQADVLFDNIQYLSDTALTPDEQAENLHVFMLSGYGEPGSMLPEDPRGDPEARRTWTCWCAAHRPQMTAPGNLEGEGSTTKPAYSNLIVLEFELDRDTFNPLYPPLIVDDASSRSGVSSPPSEGSGSNSFRSNPDSLGSNSNSSGRTLVSSSSQGLTTEYSSPETSSVGQSAGNSNPSLVTSSDLSLVNSSSPSLLSRSDPSGRDSSGSPTSSNQDAGYSLSSRGSNNGEQQMPTPEEILESTTSHSRPLLALERLRRTRRGEASDTDSSLPDRVTNRPRRPGGRRRGAGAVGMMDVFAVMAQMNEQLGAAPDLDSFLKVVAGIIKDLTQFHRVLVYQFDDMWNGKVMAELVDWNQTHDLYRGLHFPATDIPAQARNLYALNKVRLLYDRGQPTARLVVKSKKDLETPLDMTHCYLRAMSPIHVKYLENMGVRASMSVSIMAFGSLWGLVTCHSYGPRGMRVSFPVRQMLRLLSQSISRNIERLSYAQRLHTRKLINTMPTDQHPSGYIVSNADDLLGLFDADYGVLVIGEGAKILGPNQNGQEILIIAEYLRLKQFNTIQVSQAVTQDYPDLQLTTGLEVIAGLLYVPLSAGGRDFIAFLRKGQPRQVKWAGRPFKDGEVKNTLEPRSSFATWSETVAGRSRAWADEHLETAGVLALVYGKFIEVWRQKESALQTTKLTNILLSNASHEVRTPLNHIINYLELAMNGPLDLETRENLSQSHAASKSLLFTINDLLDLTRLESGNETSFNELFDLHRAINEATLLYRNEALRRGLSFILDTKGSPRLVVGDARKIRTVVANLTANALKYTMRGSISVQCRVFEEPEGLRSADDVAIEIVVQDTGCGIPSDKLESIFREFEQVESAPPKSPTQGLGLGLAVVARIVEQLGGQLRVDSVPGEGSRFSFLIPFATDVATVGQPSVENSPSSSIRLVSRSSSHGSHSHSEIDNLVEALSSTHMDHQQARSEITATLPSSNLQKVISTLEAVAADAQPAEQSKDFDVVKSGQAKVGGNGQKRSPDHRCGLSDTNTQVRLRILSVEDNDINRMILAKRLAMDGHIVVNTTNGQEGVEMVENDWDFDCILMDIQMPLLNGYEATERIREMETKRETSLRLSHKLNGRIPIFAVSASLFETRREDMYNKGLDGWILKPIDFKRLRVILRGVTDLGQRMKDVYRPGCSWEHGGWLGML